MRDINYLRESLLSVMDMLAEDKISVDRAKAICDILCRALKPIKFAIISDTIV